MGKALMVLACLAGAAYGGDRVRSLRATGADFARVEFGARGGKAYLATCDDAKACTALAVFGDEAEVLGVVDLDGAPRELPEGAAGALDARGMQRPALVVRTTTRERVTTDTRFGGKVTGDHVTRQVALFSLVPADAHRRVFGTIVYDIWPSGAGTTAKLSLVTTIDDKVRDLMVTEQRHLERASRCKRPEPTRTHYHLVDGHYQRDGSASLARDGC